MAQKTHKKEHATFDTGMLSFDRFYLEVRIKYAVLFVGLLLTILLSYSYIYFSPPGLSPNDHIKNIVLIVGAGVGLTSLIYTALSINAIRADKVRDIHIAKLIHSSEFISAWYSPSMTGNKAKVLRYAIRLMNGRITHTEKETLISEIYDDHDMLGSANSILNFLEHMAQEIRFNLVNEAYLKTFFRHIVHFYYHSFSALIIKDREDAKSISPGREVQALAERWGEGE